jgi:cysteine desulfurase
VEHASVLETARSLRDAGASLAVVGVDGDGRVSVNDVVAACTADVRLVSVGLANGEVGTVQPVAAIAAALGGRGVLVHTDAAQAAGRIATDVRRLGVDLLSLSAHKIGGPTGVGALWVRDGVRVAPLLTGGSQERGVRAGTENVLGIVGFGAAARAAREELDVAAARMAELRGRLLAGLRAGIPDLVVNGPVDAGCLPNTLSVTVPGCAGESLLVLLDLAGVAASLGSACAAGAAEPSHVLRAMGRDDAAARSGLRLSLGPGTTANEVGRVVALVPELVAQIRRRGAAA